MRHAWEKLILLLTRYVTLGIFLTFLSLEIFIYKNRDNDSLTSLNVCCEEYVLNSDLYIYSISGNCFGDQKHMFHLQRDLNSA